MNTILMFVTVLAWIIGIWATIVVIIKIALDIMAWNIRPSIRSAYLHNIMRWTIAAILCWAWVIARAITN